MLINFCKKAKAGNIPVFVVNAPSGVTYESSKEYESLGITVLPMCCFPSVYIKLWLLKSIGNLSAETAEKPVAGEFLK